MDLLTSNTKLIKSEKKLGWRILGLQLAPAKVSGYNVCASSSAGCRESCLFSAGYGVYRPVRDARISRTKFYYEDRKGFFEQLHKEINLAKAKALRDGLNFAIRLNVLSDIMWEYTGVISKHPDVQFFDYTKHIKRVMPGSLARSLSNYDLTFSQSEDNEGECLLALEAGVNVATVFSGEQPLYWLGSPVLDGDETDARFLDAKWDRGYVIGLKAKGKAKKDRSGFVKIAA